MKRPLGIESGVPLFDEQIAAERTHMGPTDEHLGTETSRWNWDVYFLSARDVARGGGEGGLSLGRGSRHCVEWLHGVEPRELLPPVHQDLRRMFEFLEQ